MNTIDVLNQREKVDGRYQNRLFEKVIIELLQLPKNHSISLNELSLKTNIQVDVLRGIMANIRETESATLDHIINESNGKLQGRGYRLTSKGRKKAIDLEKWILNQYESEQLAKKEAEIEKKRNTTNGILMVIAALFAGFFLGIGLHDALISLF